MKRLLLVFGMLVLVLFPLCAYDGTSEWYFIGSLSRYEFIREAQAVVASGGFDEFISEFEANSGLEITRFFQIDEDSVDEEDVALLNDVVAHINGNCYVRNQDTFLHFVVRGYSYSYADGWIVFSHYSQSAGWLHYLFYFFAE